MIAEGTFVTAGFTPVPVETDPAVETALTVGVATMAKEYGGDVTGRSQTLFTSAFDPARGVGSYVAMESFAGALHGAEGTFNYLHVASTHGNDRYDEHFTIVASSGTGALAGIAGTGSLTIGDDGTHRVRFDYTLE